MYFKIHNIVDLRYKEFEWIGAFALCNEILAQRRFKLEV